MNKRKLALLEKALTSEIDAAINNGIPIMQTKSKLADELVTEGLLIKAEVTIGDRMPITVHGYELTHAGRLLYCSSF